MALLEPIAQSVKCLEYSMVTVSDVTLYWLATQAMLNDYFTDPEKCNKLMLTEEIICDVRGIMNGRFAQMIQGPEHLYLESSIFTCKNINPLAMTITIPSNSGIPMYNTPNTDLHISLPQYPLARGYLGELLIHDVNSDCAPKVFEWVPSAEEILDEFRAQFANYNQRISPFDCYCEVSAVEYWTQISCYPDGDIIGYLAMKLYRIVLSSVAEGRAISTITKFNAPDQGRQKASMLLKDSKGQKLRIAPTLHFRDMPDLVKSAGKVSVDLRGIGAGSATLCMDAGYAEIHDEPAASDMNADDGDAEVQELSLEEWEREAGFDEVIEWTERGSRDVFEVDGINLVDPLLIDLLSDEPVPGVVV
ncbi:hypothetical protein FRC11_003711, partial [Ceratobasidium sp. 423]